MALIKARRLTMRKIKLLVAGLAMGSMVEAYAIPSEVVIIRHADKWAQANPGPCLAPKGQLRAERFISYFLQKFGKPDVIIAANPIEPDGSVHSVRELQTIAPLANYLAKGSIKGCPIELGFNSSQYQEQAFQLLNNTTYHNKLVLISWDHNEMPELAQALGVAKLPSPIASTDYDSVYVLKYGSNGKLANFQVLTHQYPVADVGSWESLEANCKA
jgi:hypothetical protein